jgi:superfamily II DNA or RNA helicase
MSEIITTELEERKVGKDLYSYQKGAINKIFTLFENDAEDYHLLYPLPTGGGKTVIFA